MTPFIIIAVIGFLGILSYFSSAWFGYRSSNTDSLPPHYDHLCRRLKQEKRQPKAMGEYFTEETEWFRNP
ncbi:hypothetical protein GCM10028805_00430 [Spirosoma harenae]